MAVLLVGFGSSTSYAKATDNPGSVANEHRSDVSKFVENLNRVAGEDQKIGPEVSAIAKEQSDAASKSADAINSIENRNSLVTFLFGTDYKRIGTLRSQLVTNQNEINRLTKAIARATDPSVKANLQIQIDNLKTIVAKINQFITENESRFSILGWAVRLFTKE